MKTFKILGLLLTYPTEELRKNMEDLVEVLRSENILPRKLEAGLVTFMETLAARDLLRAQEEYVLLFDRGRGNSLYLFEHIHGESRDRGQAMVDLIDHYREKGLVLNAKELPDYLPLFLEFLSICAPQEAQGTLGEVVHIVAAIGAKLKKRGSSYSIVFEALAKMTDAAIDKEFVHQALIEEAARDDSLEALDKEWDEAPAFDGIGDSSCGTCPTAQPLDFGAKHSELSQSK
ncbi:nitrate reductase molybdenum cofactor assembly chaperone [Sneathiella sp. HT1-7]|uniref:nitrate reductase molybdenum cofactor assembly chaperone n=1 Tax=Sneathiella sp. HT1-7 TaxID=2887192 RepID=UPI001D14808B|nr:nitrate reductase molybdenum cofactor assembly chaperone [Sneathiella sp. HT1-7]MCC3306748.1 nitrate reductase molybdenum cofactor assembly chaperone [Sneathiella sp. HT1-7]